MQFQRRNKQARVGPELDQLVSEIIDIEDLLALLEILKHWGVSPENLPEVLEPHAFIEDPLPAAFWQIPPLTFRERFGLLITAAFFLLLTLLNAFYG